LAPGYGEALVASKRRADCLGHRLDPHGLDRRAQGRARFGRPILEPAATIAMIVAPSADLDMAVRAIVFSASARRTALHLAAPVITHRSIRADLTRRLVKAYAGLPIGDPRTDRGRWSVR